MTSYSVTRTTPQNELDIHTDMIVNKADMNILAEIFVSKISEVLEETIERLMVPVAELEMIKMKVYLTEREVSLYFSIAPATLKTDRCRGTGVQYIKDGRKILYSINDLIDYYERRIVKTRG